VINLSGDTGGFIIPVVTLLWPLAGTGIETLARAVQSVRVTRLDPRTLVLALATRCRLRAPRPITRRPIKVETAAWRAS
jgi:hypothetical protein